MEMGAMSINFTVSNEQWLREQTRNSWGNRSNIVNRAIDQWRRRPTATQIEPTREAHEMLSALCSMLQGQKTRESPFGHLTEKENARLMAMRQQFKLLIEEFTPGGEDDDDSNQD